METILILVKPPQVNSLDPQKYLGVVLFVFLLCGCTYFFWETQCMHPQPPLQSIFVVVLVKSADARCAVVIAILIGSI